MKKSRSTRSHFTHARSCSRALNQVPTRAKRPVFHPDVFLWKGDIFPCVRFTGYKKSNLNQCERVLPFAFALTCYKIYLFFSSLSDFDSFSSPEAALLLVSTKNRDLWPCPNSRTSRHSAHALSQVWQIWLVLVPIYCVYKSIQNRNVVGTGQRSRFLVLTKRSAASGDENECEY